MLIVIGKLQSLLTDFEEIHFSKNQVDGMKLKLVTILLPNFYVLFKFFLPNIRFSLSCVLCGNLLLFFHLSVKISYEYS